MAVTNENVLYMNFLLLTAQWQNKNYQHLTFVITTVQVVCKISVDIFKVWRGLVIKKNSKQPQPCRLKGHGKRHCRKQSSR